VPNESVSNFGSNDVDTGGAVASENASDRVFSIDASRRHSSRLFAACAGVVL
jgi:hypothetical protein